jgi:hypothetical protein
MRSAIYNLKRNRKTIVLVRAPIIGFVSTCNPGGGAAVIKGMTGNKAFPTPPVDLTAVQTALDEYLAAPAAMVQGGTTATATKNNNVTY